MTNAKIYYLKQTGEVILFIPENQSQWARPTTREQDEVLFTALQAYNPQEVDVLELKKGEYASEFVSASRFRVNLDTLTLEFEYPTFSPSLTAQISELKSMNMELRNENILLRGGLLELAELLSELMEVEE